MLPSNLHHTNDEEKRRKFGVAADVPSTSGRPVRNATMRRKDAPKRSRAPAAPPSLEGRHVPLPPASSVHLDAAAWARAHRLEVVVAGLPGMIRELRALLWVVVTLALLVGAISAGRPAGLEALASAGILGRLSEGFASGPATVTRPRSCPMSP